MSEEVELAVGSIEAAMTVFVRESGALGPIRELSDWVSSFIHYRRQAALAKVVNEAAERVRELGLPIVAVQDKVLREVLEGASMEDDDDMRTRWANLLANTVTEPDGVKVAYPAILRQLDPVDAATLDRLGALAEGYPRVLPVEPAERHSLDNLTRLGLLRYTRATRASLTQIDDRYSTVNGITFTRMGFDFLEACQPPMVD